MQIKKKKLTTCYICKRRVNVKDVVLVDGRVVCRHHPCRAARVKIEEPKEATDILRRRNDEKRL